MNRIFSIVLLVLAFALSARATTIAPADWASYGDVAHDGSLDHTMHKGLWIVGSNWTSPISYTATGMFDLQGFTAGEYYFNVVIADFYLPNGNDEPQTPDILRSVQVGSFIDDGEITDADYGLGDAFALVDFPQVRGGTFSFDVSEVVNAAITNGDRWITFVFNPNWEVTADQTTFTFGTPDNRWLDPYPFSALAMGEVGAMDEPAGIFTTLGDQAFELVDVTHIEVPEPASIALISLGSLTLWRRHGSCRK